MYNVMLASKYGTIILLRQRLKSIMQKNILGFFAQIVNNIHV
jgi:hypothetical protein